MIASQVGHVAGTPEDRAEMAEVIDDAIPARGYQMLPVVGLGGSAGSLAALRTFFERMPANSGMAFVVILHLSPEHESLMAEILQRSSTSGRLLAGRSSCLPSRLRLHRRLLLVALTLPP
jgi:chemotaxis response regulator CheB